MLLVCSGHVMDYDIRVEGVVKILPALLTLIDSLFSRDWSTVFTIGLPLGLSTRRYVVLIVSQDIRFRCWTLMMKNSPGSSIGAINRGQFNIMWLCTAESFLNTIGQ